MDIDKNLKVKCSFYMENKKRNCKFEAISGSGFCHYHSQNQDFVLCPIDPSHTILKSKLETHIKICPKIKYESSLKDTVWFSQAVNAGVQNEEKQEKYEERKENEDKKLENEEKIKGNEEEIKENKEEMKENEEKMNENEEKMKENEEIIGILKEKKKKEKVLLDLEAKNPELLLELATKVDLAFVRAVQIYNESMEEEKTHADFITDTRNAISTVTTKERDFKQLELMLVLMGKFSLLDPRNVYIEYGAGKGHLSHEIATYNKDLSAHILLEKEPRRNKFDKFHRENPNFIRLRTDINDFNINTLPVILKDFKEQQPLRVVGVSKHMCGGASDLSLNSLLKISPSSGVVLSGICLVTCCHHRCSIDSYCNLPFLFALGFKAEDLPLFFKMSSWSVTTLYDEKKKEVKKTVLASERKTEVGFKVKRIIDIGRCCFLRETTKKKTFLEKYCELDLTPENFAILLRD